MIAKGEAIEPNTLTFEWNLSEDGRTSYVVETYTASDAVMAHAANIVEQIGPLFEVAPNSAMKIYGNPSNEVREMVDPLGAQYYEHFNGVTR